MGGQLKQFLRVRDLFQQKRRLSRQLTSGGEQDAAAVFQEDRKKFIPCRGGVEVINDQQRVLFQRPKEAVVLAKPLRLAVLRQIVRKVHLIFKISLQQIVSENGGNRSKVTALQFCAPFLVFAQFTLNPGSMRFGQLLDTILSRKKFQNSIARISG
jgi:hypothetical protein